MADKNYWDTPKDPKDWTNSPQVKKWPMGTGDVEAKKKAAIKSAALKKMLKKNIPADQKMKPVPQWRIPASPTK